MQCTEFREISEAYLNDELLVETCLQVFAHLETCNKCRTDLGARHDLRQAIRAAVMSSHEFQIDPAFAGRLGATLKESALRESSWRGILFGNKLLIPALGVLLLAITLGALLLVRPNRSTDVASVPNSPSSIFGELEEVSAKAAGNHDYCALEKLSLWERLSTQDFPEKAVYAEKVARPLRANFAESIELLHAHDCIFEGKEFTHVVLRDRGHIVSVFFDKQKIDTTDGTNFGSTILSNLEKGRQVASFRSRDRAVFVVSDLPEVQNVSIARTLIDSWHTTTPEKAVATSKTRRLANQKIVRRVVKRSSLGPSLHCGIGLLLCAG